MQLCHRTRNKANSEGIKESSVIFLKDEQNTPHSWPITTVDKTMTTLTIEQAKSAFVQLTLSTKHIHDDYWPKIDKD